MIPYDQRMRGSKILITGPSGQVASPIARALAADNEVWGIARFTDAAGRENLEKAGVRCETVNLASGDFTGIPTDSALAARSLSHRPLLATARLST